MYRTAERPAPLDFLLPSTHSSAYNIGRRKDLVPHSLPHLAPTFLEAPIREGLRTPPTDDMATAYQNATYSNAYSASRNSEYLSVEAPPSSYGGTYKNGPISEPRQYMSITQPPPASASTLRNEVQGTQPIISQPSSPEPAARTSFLSREEPSQRKSTSDMIRPNLQIPKSISSSGGSLAEFAAQVSSERLRIGYVY